MTGGSQNWVLASPKLAHFDFTYCSFRISYCSFRTSCLVSRAWKERLWLQPLNFNKTRIKKRYWTMTYIISGGRPLWASKECGKFPERWSWCGYWFSGCPSLWRCHEIANQSGWRWQYCWFLLQDFRMRISYCKQQRRYRVDQRAKCGWGSDNQEQRHCKTLEFTTCEATLQYAGRGCYQGSCKRHSGTYHCNPWHCYILKAYTCPTVGCHQYGHASMHNHIETDTYFEKTLYYFIGLGCLFKSCSALKIIQQQLCQNTTIFSLC